MEALYQMSYGPQALHGAGTPATRSTVLDDIRDPYGANRSMSVTSNVCSIRWS